MKKANHLIFIIIFATILLGTKDCDDGEKSETCNPGESTSCICGDTEWGIQYCNTSGTAWSRCDCSKDFQKEGPASEDPLRHSRTNP